MNRPQRGEVWVVDLGLAAKTRPCLVLSIPSTDQDRSLVTLVPHTTNLRGSRFEVAVPVPFLRPGAFGEGDDGPLLGAVTLETLGLMLNPLNRELVPMRLMLARRG